MDTCIRRTSCRTIFRFGDHSPDSNTLATVYLKFNKTIFKVLYRYKGFTSWSFDMGNEIEIREFICTEIIDLQINKSMTEIIRPYFDLFIKINYNASVSYIKNNFRKTFRVTCNFLNLVMNISVVFVAGKQWYRIKKPRDNVTLKFTSCAWVSHDSFQYHIGSHLFSQLLALTLVYM